MAAKKHNSTIMGAGILAVMALAILLGITQLNQKQVIENRAAESVEQPAGATNCSATIGTPYLNLDTNKVEAKMTATCANEVYSINNWGQITVDSGTYRLYYSGGCKNCKTATSYPFVYKNSGSHKYCSYAQLNWTEINGKNFSGPQLAGGCKTI